MRHRRRIHILVLVLYVLFNIYEADWKLRQRGNIYQDLNVPHDVGDRKVQSTFRQLSVPGLVRALYKFESSEANLQLGVCSITQTKSRKTKETLPTHISLRSSWLGIPWSIPSNASPTTALDRTSFRRSGSDAFRTVTTSNTESLRV